MPAGMAEGTAGGMAEPPQYVASRIREALAEDERTAELAVRVQVRGNRVYLQGEITGEPHRQRVLEVVREVAPALEIHDELSVVGTAEPVGEERLR
jgi:osmotically-inducible protein OsmY